MRGSVPVRSSSTIFLKYLHGAVLAYASLLPMGTWRVQVEVETCEKALELQLYSAGSVRSAKKSFKFEQPNAVFPMTLTEVGISMLFRPLHPKNASCPILITDFGISILNKRVQPENAYLTIYVTELGILILVKLVHS